MIILCLIQLILFNCMYDMDMSLAIPFVFVRTVELWQETNIYCYKEINKTYLPARWSTITNNIVINGWLWLGFSQAALPVWMNVLRWQAEFALTPLIFVLIASTKIATLQLFPISSINRTGSWSIYILGGCALPYVPFSEWWIKNNWKCGWLNRLC